MGQHSSSKKNQFATFGGGCFWCTEALFQELQGVINVRVGYAGGHVANPNYTQVSTGKTGHAEVIQIEFNPKEVGFRPLLEVFFGTHDPTSLNRQGSDVGEQYRSVIFYHNEEQRKEAEEMITRVQRNFRKKIVTALEPFDVFYKAEKEHQDFYQNNKQYPYCRIIIKPKLDKLLKNYYPYIDWK